MTDDEIDFAARQEVLRLIETKMTDAECRRVLATILWTLHERMSWEAIRTDEPA